MCCRRWTLKSLGLGRMSCGKLQIMGIIWYRIINKGAHTLLMCDMQPITSAVQCHQLILGLALPLQYHQLWKVTMHRNRHQTAVHIYTWWRFSNVGKKKLKNMSSSCKPNKMGISDSHQLEYYRVTLQRSVTSMWTTQGNKQGWNRKVEIDKHQKAVQIQNGRKFRKCRLLQQETYFGEELKILSNRSKYYIQFIKNWRCFAWTDTSDLILDSLPNLTKDRTTLNCREDKVSAESRNWSWRLALFSKQEKTSSLI